MEGGAWGKSKTGEKMSKWEVGKMKLPFQGCTLIREWGGIIRWASPRCRFWFLLFSCSTKCFPLLQRLGWEFVCQRGSRVWWRARDGQNGIPALLFTSQGKINTALDSNHELLGQFYFNASVAEGLNVQTCSLAAPVHPYTCSQPQPDWHRANCLLPCSQTVTVLRCIWVCCFFLSTVEVRDGVQTFCLLNPSLLQSAGG